MKLLPQSTVSGFHPLVGHAYSVHDGSFLLSNEKIDDGVIKISLNPDASNTLLVLGGSTSDIYYGGSWVRPFSALIQASFRTIYSCACVGYSTSQELLRLIEFVSVLKPTIIISLNGINDFGLFQAAKSHSLAHPYVHSYLNRIYDFISNSYHPTLSKSFFSQPPNRLVCKLPYPLDDGFNIWRFNISLMNSIALYHGSSFFSFLQPCLGYSPFEVSSNCLEGFYLKLLCSQKGRESYLSSMNSFYRKATNFCSGSDFAIDLTCALGHSPSNLFEDCRHLNTLGNIKLARAIYANIFD